MSKEVLNNKNGVARPAGKFKAHLSVLELYLRSSVYKTSTAIAVMALTEAGLFCWRGIRQPSFDEAVAESWLVLPFVAAFLAIAVICMNSGAAKTQSIVTYTFRRLQISEKSAYIWHFVCGVICLLLLWAGQAAVFYGLSRLWASAARDLPAEAAVYGPQGIYLAFFRNDFLHSVIPLQDPGKLVGNAAQIFACAAACSYLQIKTRQPEGERRAFAPIMVFASAPTLFRTTFGNGDVIIFSVFTAVLGAYCLIAGYNLADDGRTHTEPEEYRPVIKPGKEARDA